jgi:hypothetical protein
MTLVRVPAELQWPYALDKNDNNYQGSIVCGIFHPDPMQVAQSLNPLEPGVVHARGLTINPFPM